MKKRFVRLCALVLLCAAMCGCSLSMDDLLTPPKLTAEQNEIYKELINSVGSVKLKYPKSGDYRSAFVLKDIDDEPGLEAIVFYEGKNTQSGESNLRMKILDKTDDKWEAVYDLSCTGSEVDSISFSRIGNSDYDDIIVCYTMLNQTEKSFSVLRYRSRTPQVLYTSVYSGIEVYDLNNDGLNELLVIAADKVNQIAVAKMFTNGDNGFEKLSETMIFGGAVSYNRITKGFVSMNTPALFLDYSKGGGQSGTDVLYCYGNSLFCPNSWTADSNSGVINRVVNNYTPEINCFDIDGDSYVEIPSTTPLPGYETYPKSEQLCAVMWYTIINDKFNLQHYSYYSERYGFALLFPNRWRGIVSVIANTSASEILFVTYDEEIGILGSEVNEIMRIRCVDKNDGAAVEAAKSLTVLGENDDTLFCYIESGKSRVGTMGLTESELKDSFIIL